MCRFESATLQLLPEGCELPALHRTSPAGRPAGGERLVRHSQMGPRIFLLDVKAVLVDRKVIQPVKICCFGHILKVPHMNKISPKFDVQKHSSELVMHQNFSSQKYSTKK